MANLTKLDTFQEIIRSYIDSLEHQIKVNSIIEISLSILIVLLILFLIYLIRLLIKKSNKEIISLPLFRDKYSIDFGTNNNNNNNNNKCNTINSTTTTANRYKVGSIDLQSTSNRFKTGSSMLTSTTMQSQHTLKQQQQSQLSNDKSLKFKQSQMKRSRSLDINNNCIDTLHEEEHLSHHDQQQQQSSQHHFLSRYSSSLLSSKLLNLNRVKENKEFGSNLNKISRLEACSDNNLMRSLFKNNVNNANNQCKYVTSTPTSSIRNE